MVITNKYLHSGLHSSYYSEFRLVKFQAMHITTRKSAASEQNS